ncbi:MAG: PQQ-dependent sugar dehydrogenase, partial [Bacteroidota bacterium]
FKANAQAINPPVILPGDMGIVVEKYVRFPDNEGVRPRINSFTFTGDRKFVSDEGGGRIFEIIDNPTGLASLNLFIDLRTAIPLNTNRNLNFANSWHGGLRDVAFHPEFASNGKFYTSVMEDRPADPSMHTYLSDVTNPVAGDGVLLEWTYDHSAGEVDPNSYREVFRVGMPVYDHPIKNITFNQFAQPGDEDYGLLYIAHGDGSVQSATAGGGQNNDALGKIMRINPLSSGGDPYTVPATNPFVADPSYLDELYAVGFRNPHNIRFNMDLNGNVHLICADAGRDNMEEINVIQAGGNYGWSEREGTFVHLAGGGLITGIAPLPANEASFGFTYPSAQWIHTGSPGAGFVGQAIAGGSSYIDYANNINHCVFADFARTGRLFYSDMLDLVAQKTTLNAGEQPSALTQAQVYEYQVYFDHDNDVSTPALARDDMRDVINDEPTHVGNRADLRFGNDGEGNLYITSKRNGWVYKVQTVNTNQALPIELTSFSGEALKKANRLEWVSSLEENTDRHEIERSANGQVWQQIGTVAAAGNSTEVIAYDFLDEAPLNRALYRVRTVDIDGSSSLSPLVEIARDDVGNQLTVGNVYPQPTTGLLNIPVIPATGQERLSLSLLDGMGRKIRQHTIQVSAGRNQISFDLTDLPNGLYWLRVADEQSSMVTKKVILQ